MRLIVYLLLLFISKPIDSCNLCWNYKVKDPRLQRETIDHDPQCTCPCWQYPHTKGTNNFYKCQVCEHRLTPPDVISKDGPQYKRFYHKGDRDFKATNFKYPAKSPEKNLKPLGKAKKIDFSKQIKTINKD